MTALPIVLPTGFVPLVSSGTSISAGQLIAHNTDTSETLINIATSLKIPLSKVKKVLKKNPGDAINVGDIIAEKKGFFGIDRDTVISKVAGTVTRYERHTGNLAIRSSQAILTKKLVSPVDGAVSLCNNEQIVIQTDTNVLVGIQGSGKTAESELCVLDESFRTTSQASLLYHIDSRAIGKIIVSASVTREMLMKGLGLGVKGIIAQAISQDDMEYLVRRKVETPVIQLDEPGMESLRQWPRKKAFVDGEGKTVIMLSL